MLPALMVILSLTTLAAGQPDTSNVPPATPPPEFHFGWMLAKTVFSLLLIIALIFGLLFVARRYLGQQLPGSIGGEDCQIIAKFPIQPKQSLLLVQVFGRLLLLGVTESSITFLAEFEPNQDIQKWMSRLEQGPRGFSNASFWQLMKRQMQK